MEELRLTGAKHGVNAVLNFEEDTSMGADYVVMQVELPDRGLSLTLAGPREEVREVVETSLLAGGDEEFTRLRFRSFFGLKRT